MRGSRPILLAEDDSVDAMTVKRVLKELKVENQLVHKLNGEKAMQYLRDSANQKPCVILLDLNMPRMNGIEFLEIVKADDELRKIPVIVLTTSKQEEDIVESFNLSVAGYIVKPADYKKFMEAIRTFELYWSLSELPAVG